MQHMQDWSCHHIAVPLVLRMIPRPKISEGVTACQDTSLGEPLLHSDLIHPHPIHVRLKPSSTDSNGIKSTTYLGYGSQRVAREMLNISYSL